jgi:hypothetical protein
MSARVQVFARLGSHGSYNHATIRTIAQRQRRSRDNDEDDALGEVAVHELAAVVHVAHVQAALDVALARLARARRAEGRVLEPR